MPKMSAEEWRKFRSRTEERDLLRREAQRTARALASGGGDGEVFATKAFREADKNELERQGAATRTFREADVEAFPKADRKELERHGASTKAFREADARQLELQKKNSPLMDEGFSGYWINVNKVDKKERKKY